MDQLEGGRTPTKAVKENRFRYHAHKLERMDSAANQETQPANRKRWSNQRRLLVISLAVLLALAVLVAGLRIRVVLAERACLAAASSADVRVGGPLFSPLTLEVQRGKRLGITMPEGWWVNNSSDETVLPSTIDCPSTSRARAFVARSPGRADVVLGPASSPSVGSRYFYSVVHVVVP